jgi:hypothetical protein
MADNITAIGGIQYEATQLYLLRCLNGDFDESDNSEEEAAADHGDNDDGGGGMEWREFEEDQSDFERSRSLLKGGNFGYFPLQMLTGDSEVRAMKSTLFKKPLYKDSRGGITLEDFSKGILMIRQKCQRMCCL